MNEPGAWAELTLRTEPHPETRSFSSSFNAKSHVCRAVTVQGEMPYGGGRAKPAFSAWVGFREYFKLDLMHVHTPFLFMLSFKTSVASITIFTCPFSEKLIFRTNSIKYLNNYKSSYEVNPAVQTRLKCFFDRCGMSLNVAYKNSVGVSVCF